MKRIPFPYRMEKQKIRRKPRYLKRRIEMKKHMFTKRELYYVNFGGFIVGTVVFLGGLIWPIYFPIGLLLFMFIISLRSLISYMKSEEYNGEFE